MNNKESKKRICPFGHTDEVIPVITGLCTKEAYEEAKRGEVYIYGIGPLYEVVKEIDENGNEVSKNVFIGPNGYCKKHKIIF